MTRSPEPRSIEPRASKPRAPKDRSLVRVLFADALTCVGCGLLLTLAAAPLAELLALPQPLLFWSGVSLFPIAGVIATVASVPRARPSGVWAVVAGNAAWALASFGVIAALSPSLLGEAFVAGQALVVAALAVLEARLVAGAPDAAAAAA